MIKSHQREREVLPTPHGKESRGWVEPQRMDGDEWTFEGEPNGREAAQ